MKISFTIPDLPKMPNQLLTKHWRYASKESNKWHGLVRLFTNRYKPDKPFNQAKLTLIRYSTTEPDYDGLVGSFKWVVDGLVKSGIIIDDKYSVIGQSTYKWEKSKRKDQRISVLVEPI